MYHLVRIVQFSGEILSSITIFKLFIDCSDPTVVMMLEMMGKECTTPGGTAGTGGTTGGGMDCCDPANMMLCGMLGLSCNTGGTTTGGVVQFGGTPEA